MMLLNELLVGLDIVNLDGNLNRAVTGVTYDVRRVSPGMVYCAILGRDQDGHEHIEQAIEQGAVGIVSERNGMIRNRAAKIQVRHSRNTLAKMSARLLQHPERKLKIIAVTGGKSRACTAFFLKQIMEQSGHATALISSIRCEIGSRILPGITPHSESLDYQQILASSVRSGMTSCVIELDPEMIGSHRLGELGFDLMVITRGIENDQEIPAVRLIERLAHSGRKTIIPVVLGLEDDFGRRLRGGEQVQVQYTYGFSERAQVRAANIGLLRDGTRFTLQTDQKQFPCPTQIVGRGNLMDMLAAIAGAKAVGIGTNQIIQSVRQLTAPGILQPLRHSSGWSVFVDGARSPAELKEVLGTLRELGPKKLITVFGCPGDSSQDHCAAMGQVAAEGADLSIITSDNPKHESPRNLALKVLGGYATRRNDGARMELDRSAAILSAIRTAEPGDIVLIAGKGHDNVQEIAGAIIPFDDLDNAREAVLQVKQKTSISITHSRPLGKMLRSPKPSWVRAGYN